MDLLERLVQVKSSGKEEDLFAYTPNDILFLFGDITQPVGLILNHSDPSECFVLFPSAVPMQDIYSLNESPSWVGASVQLAITKPHSSILPIVTKLLEDKALEEGEEYENIPIELLEPRVLEVLGHILLLKEEISLLPLPWLNRLKTWGHRNFSTSCLLSSWRWRADRMPLLAQPMRYPPSFRLYWRRGPSGQISPSYQFQWGKGQGRGFLRAMGLWAPDPQKNL